jgi:hypothetical protein
MDKIKRQKRFEQKTRNVVKWVKRLKKSAKVERRNFTTEDEKNAHIRANHGKLCSCDICCNPRRSPLHKGIDRITIQEAKENERAKSFDSTVDIGADEVE